MFTRQKVLLELLRQAKRPVERVELVKWAFLLRHEQESAGGPSFYEFVPFERGPYSFTLKYEVDAMIAEGLIETKGDFWSLGATVPKFGELPNSIAADIHRIGERFGKRPLASLLDHVYSRHPYFTMNSTTKRLAPRPVAAAGIYTAGYEGLLVDGFLNRLIENGIQRFIDVRSNPTARRFGFHKSTLNRLCGQLGIEYVHIPELGIASSQRQNIDKSDNRQSLLNWYENQWLDASRDELETAAKLVKEKPSVLVCIETHAYDCHRGRLASRLAKMTGLKMSNLGQVSL